MVTHTVHFSVNAKGAYVAKAYVDAFAIQGAIIIMMIIGTGR